VADLYEQTYHKLRRLLAEQTGVPTSSISRASAFAEDFDTEPLELYEEVFPEIEEQFQIEIEPAHYRELTTVQDMVDYIVDKAEL